MSALKEIGEKNLDTTVRAVRLALKPGLPGNRPGDTRAELPASLEEAIVPWLQAQGGRWFLAIPPEATQKLLGDIRDFMRDRSRLCAIVTRGADLRPCLRRLIELEHPDVMVLSAEELTEESGSNEPREVEA